MRYVYRNQRERDTWSVDLVCQHRRHMLIDLKFDHQIHPVAHEFVRVAQRCGTVVTIVERDQVNPRRRGGSLQAVCHGFRKRHFRRLTAKTEAYLLGVRQQSIQSVLRLGHIAAMHKCFEDAINRGLGNIRALVDGLEREGALLVLQESSMSSDFESTGTK
jgi:hypothetical protein